MDVSISVIVPIYNTEQYLKECLDSIINQSIPFDEVILINDGSTDNSLEICYDFCKRYESVALYNQSNKGLSAVRNAGLKIAKGDYVFFLDSDDYIESDLVEKIKKSLSKDKVDVLFFNASTIYAAKGGNAPGYFVRQEQFYEKVIKGTDFLKQIFPQNYIVSACTAAYRRKYLIDNNLYFCEGIYFEDIDFCLRNYLAADSIKCIEDFLYVRRCRENSITTSDWTEKKCRDYIKIVQNVSDILLKASIEVDFALHFMSYNLLNIWRTIYVSKFMKDIEADWKKTLKDISVKWSERYLKGKLSFDDTIAVLLLVKECKRLNISTLFGYDSVKRGIEKELTNKLQSLLLGDERKKIGIYGVGKHTQALVELYNYYLGDIKADICFIVTSDNDNKNLYMGRKVFNYNNIPFRLDFVLVSSFAYQHEMVTLLKKQGFSEHDIMRLYDPDSFCSIISVLEVLKYGDF